MTEAIYGRDDLPCQGHKEWGLRLTILSVVHNEQEMLPDCLASVQFADKIIVVLDRCQDQSEQIAHQYGAETFSGQLA